MGCSVFALWATQKIQTAGSSLPGLGNKQAKAFYEYARLAALEALNSSSGICYLVFAGHHVPANFELLKTNPFARGAR
jgi:hypothetical protein